MLVTVRTFHSLGFGGRVLTDPSDCIRWKQVILTSLYSVLDTVPCWKQLPVTTSHVYVKNTSVLGRDTGHICYPVSNSILQMLSKAYGYVKLDVGGVRVRCWLHVVALLLYQLPKSLLGQSLLGLSLQDHGFVDSVEVVCITSATTMTIDARSWPLYLVDTRGRLIGTWTNRRQTPTANLTGRLVFTRPTNTIQNTLQWMLFYQLIELCVVDDNFVPIGRVNCKRLIRFILPLITSTNFKFS